MLNKIRVKYIYWIVISILSILIGLYPVAYFLGDSKFGLLGGKSVAILSSFLWNIAFYAHIILGGLALFIGWVQFNQKLRKKHIRLHRIIGVIYVISVLISGISGVYVGFFAEGGLISALGFVLLGIVWVSTTVFAFIAVKNREIELHEKLMTYSYASCFAAVTLRLWLPLLVALFGEFIISFQIVAWLCWVPNLIVVYFVLKKKQQNTDKVISLRD